MTAQTFSLDRLDDDQLAALYPRTVRVRVNFVSSLDGAVSMAGVSAPLSSKADKRVFHLLRKLCDTILVGAGTFRKERYGLGRYPSIVIVSNSLDLDPEQPALAGALILTTGQARNARLAEVAEIVRCRDLVHGLELLRERGLEHILCEGGPHLFGELAALDLVDELCLTLSPLLAGPGAGRIIEGRRHTPRSMMLRHVLTATDGTVLLRHSRNSVQAKP
jgi:riboflavin biosynthesis pyrimidine reductase